jgi:hypothetical protein
LKETRPKPGSSSERKLTLGLLLTWFLVLVTLLPTLTWLLLAGLLLAGLRLPTTALLTTLSGLLVLLTAALSALILISHIYCYSCGIIPRRQQRPEVKVPWCHEPLTPRSAIANKLLGPRLSYPCNCSTAVPRHRRLGHGTGDHVFVAALPTFGDQTLDQKGVHHVAGATPLPHSAEAATLKWWKLSA